MLLSEGKMDAKWFEENVSCSCLILKLGLTLVTAWTIYNPAGSSVHGIFQARVLEWIAIFSPGELPNPLLLHGQVGFFFITKPTENTMNSCLLKHFS